MAIIDHWVDERNQPGCWYDPTHNTNGSEALADRSLATNYGMGHHIYEIPRDDLVTVFLVNKTT